MAQVPTLIIDGVTLNQSVSILYLHRKTLYVDHFAILLIVTQTNGLHFTNIIYCLTQLPIIEYLDETRPENKLLPQDPVERAKVGSSAAFRTGDK